MIPTLVRAVPLDEPSTSFLLSEEGCGRATAYHDRGYRRRRPWRYPAKQGLVADFARVILVRPLVPRWCLLHPCV